MIFRLFNSNLKMKYNVTERFVKVKKTFAQQTKYICCKLLIYAILYSCCYISLEINFNPSRKAKMPLWEKGNSVDKC